MKHKFRLVYKKCVPLPYDDRCHLASHDNLAWIVPFAYEYGAIKQCVKCKIEKDI